MLTQSELEELANQMRWRGMHLSWNELMEFSQSVVGALVDAYQAVLRDSECPQGKLTERRSGSPAIVKTQLARALKSLTSETQVTKWESEAFLASGLNVAEK
jgi:hypothetical protein